MKTKITKIYSTILRKLSFWLHRNTNLLQQNCGILCCHSFVETKREECGNIPQKICCSSPHGKHFTEDLLLFSSRQTFHRFVALLLTANISQICCSSPHGKHFTENLLLFSSRQTFHRICCSSPHDKHFTEDLLLFSSRQTFHRRFVALLLTAND